MDRQAGDSEWPRSELTPQLVKQRLCVFEGDLVLNRDMGTPAGGIWSGQHAMEMVGNGVPDRFELVRHDAKGNAIRQIHQSGNRRPRRRLSRMECKLVPDFLDSRGW